MIEDVADTMASKRFRSRSQNSVTAKWKRANLIVFLFVTRIKANRNEDSSIMYIVQTLLSYRTDNGS